MTISFIIPVLNGKRYLKKCIDAILQEYATLDEIIVVDGGSIDGTIEIASSYPQVQLLKISNTTIANSRNHGAKLAKSGLLAFIDCDVIICKGWRKNALDILSDDSIHATGSRYDIPENPNWIEKAWYSQRAHEIKNINYINSGNFIVKKDVFNFLNGFNEELVTDEDCDFCNRLNEKGFVIVEAPSVHAIHIGNPQSLLQFFKREKWHSHSLLQTQKWNKIDKPFAMSIIFIITCLCGIALIVSAFFSSGYPALGVALICCVPLITAFYRIAQYRNSQYLFSIIILYFLFYSARAVVIGFSLKKRIFSISRLHVFRVFL